MARIEGAPAKGFFVRVGYWVSRWTIRRRLGRKVPETTEPVKIWAHNRKLMQGYGMLELMLGRSRTVPIRLKTLARARVSPLIGCLW